MRLHGFGRTPALLLLAAASLAAAPSIAYAQSVDDRSYRAGIGLLNKGLSDLAANEFRKYLDEHPDGPQATNARYSLAVCLSRLGKHAEALPHLEQVVREKDFEFAADSLLLLAQCQQAGGDDGAAITTLRDLTRRHAQFRQMDRATAMLGESLYRTGDFEDAARTLRMVAAQWPKSSAVDRADLFAAMSESAQGNAAAAAELAARLRARSPQGEYALNAALVEARCRQQLGDLPAAAKFYEAAIAAKAPLRAEALLGLAGAARLQGDTARADKALAALENETVPAELSDWVTLEKGKVLLQKNDAPAAARAFKEVRKSSRKDVQVEAAHWAAKCQAKAGKHAEAAANLEDAAAKFSDSPLVPEMLFDRAASLSQAGDEQAGLEAWDAWTRRYGSHALFPQAVIAHAWAAHRAGQFDRSGELIAALVAKIPARGKDETVELLLAENAFAQNDFAAALAGYSVLVQDHPASPHASRAGFRRVMCLVGIDRAEEAGAALTSALESKHAQDPALRRAAITRLADHAFGKSSWKTAETWFERLTGEPLEGEDRLDALLRHAITVQRQDRFDEALKLLDRVVVQDANSVQARQARFEQGQCFLQLGKLNEAKAVFENVSSSESGDALASHAKRHLAAIASKQGRHEEAATQLAELSTQSSPGVAGASRLELGSAYLAAGKFEEARAALTQHLESDDPRDAPKARALLGIATNRLGDHQQAVDALTQVVGNKSFDADTKASVVYELALSLRSLNQEVEAAKAFQAVADLGHPRLGTYARLDLAQIETKAARFEPALKLLDLALASTATLPAGDASAIKERATYLRASCLLRLSRPREAADTLKGFAESYPTSPLLAAARLVRGEALLATGDSRGAADEFTLASAADAAEVRSSAALRLGDAYAAAQDWPRSDEAFTKFLDRESTSPLWFQARFGQGWARENQGRHDAAIEAYRDVIARHDGPTAARAQFQVGECLYAQKKLDAAITEFLKTDVLYAYPEWSAASLYEAARCLDELSRPDDATRQYDDLIKRFPDTRWARLATDRKRAVAPAPIPGQSAAEPTQPTRR